MMLFFIFTLGLFIGSFLNLLIDRIPRGEQIIKGRSKCDKCRHELSWIDLIPVLSWVYLRGRCRYCKNPIPARNTLVEILTGVLFTLTAFNISDMNIHLLLYLVIISSFISIFFIDLKHYIIPDLLTIVAAIASVALWVVLPDSLSFSNYILSALGASGFFLLLVLITKGRGMGVGDVKFAFVMGILLGYPGVVIALYIAFLTGAVLSAILIVRKKKRFGQTVPFGPFLVFGTLIVMYNAVPQNVLLFIFPYLYW